MRFVSIAALLFAVSASANAADITTSYGVPGTSPPVRVDPVVTLCPSADGSNTVVACASGGGGSVPTGTAGTPNAAVVSTQGIVGGTPTSVTDTGDYTQGSATAGQTGNLVQGAVTTAAPTYTTGTTAPASLTPAGGLRVTIGSGTTGISASQTFTSAATANDAAIGVAGLFTTTVPLITSGQATALRMDSLGSLKTSQGGQNTSLNITTATTVKASRGRLMKVIVNTPGSTATTIIDSTSTTVTAANTVLTIPAASVAGAIYEVDWMCVTGIGVVPGTGAVLAASFE